MYVIVLPQAGMRFGVSSSSRRFRATVRGFLGALVGVAGMAQAAVVGAVLGAALGAGHDVVVVGRGPGAAVAAARAAGASAYGVLAEHLCRECAACPDRALTPGNQCTR